MVFRHHKREVRVQEERRGGREVERDGEFEITSKLIGHTHCYVGPASPEYFGDCIYGNDPGDLSEGVNGDV